jgi:hypothetical protein
MGSSVDSKNANRLKNIKLVGTLADGEGWSYDSASETMIPASGAGGDSIYTADGTLTGAREVTANTSLTFKSTTTTGGLSKHVNVRSANYSSSLFQNLRFQATDWSTATPFRVTGRATAIYNETNDFNGTNGALVLGTVAPGSGVYFGVGDKDSTASIKAIINSAGLYVNGRHYVDGGLTTLKGSGSTSGTTALLVQNSLGTDLLEVKDDGTILGAFPVGAGSGTDSFQTNGVGSNASALYAIALGFSASASGGNGIAIGNQSIGGANGIGIGALASSSGAQSVAIGTGSSCAALEGVALGRNSNVVASATYGVALGFSSVSSGGNGIAIGNQSIGGANGIGIGGQAQSASDGISIGTLANSSATKGISFGFNMKSTADYALMFGGSTAAKTNATTNSVEFNFNEATSTIRLAKSADSWINTSANFGFGLTTPTAKLDIAANTASEGQLRLRTGVAPTTPNDGEIWFDGTDLKMRVGGVTKTFTLV